MFKENPENLEPKTENLEEKSPENQEQEIDPENLAEQKTQEMENDFSDLKRTGEEGIEKANDSIGLEAESATQIAADLGVEEKNSGILEKAGDLLKKSKSAMKKLIAGGMATMAFSGGGDLNTASAEETFSQGKTGVTDTVKDSTDEEKRNRIMENYEKGNYTEVLKDAGIDVNKIKTNEVEAISKENPEEDVEEIRSKLVSHIGSQEYLERLKIEFNGDEKKAKQVQEERLNNLNLDNLDLSFVDKKDLGVEYATDEVREKYLKNIPLPRWMIKAVIDVGGFSEKRSKDGYYYKNDHRVVLSKDTSKDNVAHEFFHGSVRSNEISEKAQKILSDSYEDLDEKKIINPEFLKLQEEGYFESPQERIVRKQSLDLQMQKLGIKRYGEEFTKEHKRKMMEAYEEGKFSQDVNEFIETTKPEYFEKIFNEIASNEKIEDKNQIT